MFRLPKPTERTIFIGATGSGKSVAAMDILSQMNWHVMPWVIIDYKGDELIEQVVDDNPKLIQEISPTDKVPKKPGLYYMRPSVKRDDDAVEDFLLRVYDTGRVGLFIDEGYAIPERHALDMILTQGRSKRIPVIILYQRPVYMTRFATAQASFFACFDQNDERDLKTTQEFVKPAIAPDGTKITVRTALPKYCSLWFDVGKRQSTVLRPFADPATVRAQFRNRLQPMQETQAPQYRLQLV